MKKSTLLIIGLALFLANNALAQGPNLSLVGGSPGFAKGTINTEVLTQIIQQKQDEVKQRVYRNLIVDEFNKHNATKDLRNFTTYNYIYQLMDIVTSGKNKTVITKSIIQNTTDFAYVYSVYMYLDLNSGKTEIKNARVKTDTTSGDKKRFYVKKADTNNVKIFNQHIDLIYDILLHHPELHPGFEFGADPKSEPFKTWYNSDNVYLNAPKDDVARLKSERTDYIARISILAKTIKSVNDAIKNGGSAIKDKFYDLIEAKTVNDTALVNSLLPALPVELKNLINSNLGSTNDIIQLIQFYGQLNKSNFKDFTLTKDQYYALKYIMQNFLKLAKNQFENDVVGSIIDFMLENTIVEYKDVASDTQITEQSAAATKAGAAGYLYVDIEALISAVYKKFVPIAKRGKYFDFFLTLGVNQAVFDHTNNLTVDAQGTPANLKNLYFASEKIGFEVKLYNAAFTHAFAPGEKYVYYYRQHSWLRPQQQPFISDVHILVYGSGLLYNLVSLKSDDKFNYAVAGGGIGITFFNGLKANLSIARPFINKSLSADNQFFNFGIDIPIIDYIAGLAKNK